MLIMESPVGRIFVKETRNNNEFTFFLENMVIGKTLDLEKWSSVVVSTNGKKLIGMVNRNSKETIFFKVQT